MKKCPKTLSGKHYWAEYFNGWEKIERVDAPVNLSFGVPKTLTKCLACGMIDDLESMRSKKKVKSKEAEMGGKE